jgi:hypothetical protein
VIRIRGNKQGGGLRPDWAVAGKPAREQAAGGDSKNAGGKATFL